MRPRSRLRWIATIAATLLLAMAAGLWSLTGWRWIFLSDGRAMTAYLVSGTVAIEVNQQNKAAARWSSGALSSGRWPEWSRGTGWTKTPRGQTGPLIDVVGTCAVPAILLWVWPTKRRRREGDCRKCGYDLTGNVSGRCPECGTATGAEDCSSLENARARRGRNGAKRTVG